MNWIRSTFLAIVLASYHLPANGQVKAYLTNVPATIEIGFSIVSVDNKDLSPEDIAKNRKIVNVYLREDDSIIFAAGDSGNANGGGGGGGGYIRDPKGLKLSDPFYKNSDQFERAKANKIELKELPPGVLKIKMEFDPNHKLQPEQLKILNDAKQKKQVRFTALIQSGPVNTEVEDSSYNKIWMYFDDSFYENLGKHYFFVELPSGVRQEIARAQQFLEKIGIHDAEFWLATVAGSQVNYRIVSTEEFKNISCPKYLSDLTKSFAQHRQFGCTYLNSTYLVSEFISGLQNDFFRQAMAIIHERLWSKTTLNLSTNKLRESIAFFTSRLTDLLEKHADAHPSTAGDEEEISQLKWVARQLNFQVEDAPASIQK